jgi:hypothetical protein
MATFITNLRDCSFVYCKAEKLIEADPQQVA